MTGTGAVVVVGAVVYALLVALWIVSCEIAYRVNRRRASTDKPPTKGPVP